MSKRRSYWQSCVSDTQRAKEAIASWFTPMSDGMTPYKAEVLCDVETDTEKKLRAFMTDAEGQHFVLTRTRRKRDTVIAMKRIEPAYERAGEGERGSNE